MKKVFLFIFAMLLLAPLGSFALQSQVGDTVNVVTPVNEDLYVAGGDVTIDSFINQDLSVAGGRIVIDSTIGEDLLVAGADINIEGTVGESAKIAGGQIYIDARIQNDLLVGGGDVVVSRNTTIQGDTLIGAGALKFDGTTNNANLNAGELVLQGTIRGDAIIRAEKITVLPGARILGNLNYQSKNTNPDLEAIVSGTVSFKKLPIKRGMQIFGGIVGAYITFGFVFLLVFGILLFYLGRKWFVKPIKNLKAKPRQCLGYGFLVYAAIPFAILLLFVSVIGIPFGLVLLAIYICLFAFFKLFNIIFYSHFLITQWGGMKKLNTWKQLGIILLCVILSVLMAGVGLIFTFFALGSVIKTWSTKSKK